MRWASHLAATGTMLLVGSEALGQTSDIHERDDKFRPHREVFTSQHRAGAYPDLIGLRLVGRIERASGARTTLLEVEFAYMSDDKRGYEAARNDRAEALRLTPVSSTGRCRTGSSCPYGERFTVDLPETQLRQASPQGYALKLFARNGPEALVTIPKASIVSLLERLDRDRRAPGEKQPAQAAAR